MFAFILTFLTSSIASHSSCLCLTQNNQDLYGISHKFVNAFFDLIFFCQNCIPHHFCFLFLLFFFLYIMNFWRAQNRHCLYFLWHKTIYQCTCMCEYRYDLWCELYMEKLIRIKLHDQAPKIKTAVYDIQYITIYFIIVFFLLLVQPSSFFSWFFLSTSTLHATTAQKNKFRRIFAKYSLSFLISHCRAAHTLI